MLGYECRKCGHRKSLDGSDECPECGASWASLKIIDLPEEEEPKPKPRTLLDLVCDLP